ncbi:hypothetical protein L1049_014162 [Liquidambar formosana]|uniref:Lysosomal Pro-X carboxypeptidase n=1 Tax=Liquidambar formosana TaxID=63359 RepID=A0AAP0RML6_LIQFO
MTSSTRVAARQFNMPRLSALRETIVRDPQTKFPSISDDFKTYCYPQTLDHFNYRPEGYTTFQQRYVINYKHWGGPNSSAPMFAYLGAEASLDWDLGGIGFLNDNAPRFNALQIYIEHRYYGESIPFGSREEALKNSSTLGYFNSAQAIADYAAVIIHVKKKLLAENSPVIVIGASYGGMLASWFRLKYPHVALGALASSAPILYFDDITPQEGYYSIVAKDFREASESCSETIQKSWSEIDRVASEPNGLSVLSKRFKTCGHLNESYELTDYLDSIYTSAAQYNHPPTYPVTVVCGGIDGAAEGTDILSRIYAGVVAYMGNSSCYNTDAFNDPNDETTVGWRWQTCSEMVMPIGISENVTMFPPAPFDLNIFNEWCKSTYGILPRPHWVTTYYGGNDIKLILNRFASNIIFSNGLRDPYSSGGVLENISDSVVAVHTINGSHCLDVLPPKQSDPKWLVDQRKIEVEIIEGWIANSQTFFLPEEMAMDPHKFLFQWLSLLCLILSSCVSAKQFSMPRLGALRRTIQHDHPAGTLVSPSVLKEFKTFYFTQTLDHFSFKPESYTTFKQRYLINFKYWGGPNASAPIFAYLGAEAPIDDDLADVGFLTDNAFRFKALLIYIEHRYYGKSIPFGSREEALKNSSTRGFFNSAQAIADYAAVLLCVKKQLFAKNSPVIVIGGSYGGMLASWFRLKYPHVALGALASSAPILYFDDITPQNGYYSIVTKDYREVSENCYKTIQKSWAEIDKVASKSNGLTTLTKRFKTCDHLNSSYDLKDYLDYLYADVAQYNHPPTYPVTVVCSGIDGVTEGTDILGQIFAGLVAYKGKRSCYDTNEFNHPTETNEGWRWQTCSEMVMPIGRGSNDTMFPPAPFNLNSFMKNCKSLYGIMPRPHWITTFYGGHGTKLFLQRFASNIIFSNGLRDPYSSGGVVENISESVVAIFTVRGSHCLDILPAKQSDPQWLVTQREMEIEIIEGWITKYYADLGLI